MRSEEEIRLIVDGDPEAPEPKGILIAPLEKPAKRQKDRAYLAWLRLWECCVPDCDGGCEDAHHRKSGTDGAMGRKPSDRFAVPMCHRHHMELHQKGGEARFERKHGIDLEQISKEFQNRFAKSERRWRAYWKEDERL